MTINQFDNLDETEQIEAVWNSGLLFSQRQDEIYSYTLYQIDNFFVELKTHIAYDVLHGMRGLEPSDVQSLYLIDLSRNRLL